MLIRSAAETALSALGKGLALQDPPLLSMPFRCKIGDGRYGEGDRWAREVYSGKTSGRLDTVCDPCYQPIGPWSGEFP